MKAVHHDDSVFEKNISALALTLGAQDEHQISRIFPDRVIIGKMSDWLIKQNLSVFGTFPFKGLRDQLGVFLDQKSLLSTSGKIDSIKPIDGDSHFWAVSGQIIQHNEMRSPKIWMITNLAGKIVGFVLTDPLQANLFRGYVLKEGTDQETHFIVTAYRQMHQK